VNQNQKYQQGRPYGKQIVTACGAFNLSPLDPSAWERKRDKAMKAIDRIINI